MAFAHGEHAPEAGSQFFIVRDHHQGCAQFALQIQHQIQNHLRIFAVEIACWLIGQQAFGLGHQGTGDGGTLALTTRQFGWAMVYATAQADFFQHFNGAFFRFGLVHLTNEQWHFHVFQGGEFGQ